MSQLLSTIPTKASSGQHVVKSGDTLTKISALYGVTVQQLTTANQLTNMNLIRVGQLLIIPTTNYTVKAGDILIKIAKAHNVTVQQLVDTNKLTNPNLLKIGQILKIPAKLAATTMNYKVKSGDTLYSIANKYGVKVQSIVTANKLASANVITVGQVLKIPTK